MKKKWLVWIIVLIISFAFAIPAESMASQGKSKMTAKDELNATSGKPRVKLVFVMGQAFGNGPVVLCDTTGMKRVIDALKPLREHYDVYVLFEPQVADKDNLRVILDLCVENNQPFMFDAISSDGMALAAAPQTAPFDEVHGVEISIQDMAKYKRRYGDYFAGIRFMEVFGQDFSVRCVKTTSPEWKGQTWGRLPEGDDRFFRADIVRPFFQFAQDNNMFVQWSDHHWYRFKSWDPPQKENEDALRGLLKEFPGLVTITYANNEAAKESIGRLDHWQEAVESFAADGAAGFGLSDQPWMYFIPDKIFETECPIEEIVAWARSALELGCRYIQFEPYWYFFEFPRGILTPEPYNYTKGSGWEHRGKPTPQFKTLANELLKPVNQKASPKKSKKITTSQGDKFRPIHVENGVFLYPDGSEVALFGTGYHPMSWYQYSNMKTLGADFRQAVKQDVSDMKACGVQILRLQCFEHEICDGNGNLVKNEHLDILDTLVDELNQQGIYLYLVPLAWWESPWSVPDAYSRKITKMRMMYGEHALNSSENFINQLLTHKNPYTKRQLKDEPCLVIFEIINEPWYWPYESVSEPNFDRDFLAWQAKPEVVEKDFELWNQMWHHYCKEKQVEPSKESYKQFQYEKMSVFLRRMIGAIRNTGANQPIVSALFESYSNEKHNNAGIFKAIAESNVDAVTDGWYPGAFDTLHEYVNQMSIPKALAYQLPPEVQHKAKTVYEFDICRTYNNVIMYPAIVRRWRSMGAQICCQFQYDSAVTASYNTDWGPHYFNYEYTPAKAVAFKVAAETFAAIPRGTQYPTPTDNEIFFGTAVSFEHGQVLRVVGNRIYHAHSLEGWIPLQLPSRPFKPSYIMGRGNSLYVEYTGSGLYVLEEVSQGKIQLRTTRNAVVQGKINKEWFDNGTLGVSRVILNNNAEQFRLKLYQWDSFRCFDEKGQEVKVDKDTFEVVPGKTYLLHTLGQVR